MQEVFRNLAIVMGAAAAGGIAAKLLRQPAIVGYLAAGIGLAAAGWGVAGQKETVEILGQLGVTLLLFLVGLELPLAELKRSGSTFLKTGLLQIGISAVLGFGLAKLFGFSVNAAIYLGIALTFGSTVIVVQMLSAKRDLQSLYGRLAVGHLLVQDFVAIGILTVLSGLPAGGGVRWENLLGIVLKGMVITGAAVWLSDKVLPKVLDRLARSTETLFIAAMAWCLGLAALAVSKYVGLTVEMGGFLAGLALAGAAQNLQITARVRPLRDFFMTWFFVAMGANIMLTNVSRTWAAVAAMSVFILVVNPLIVMLILTAQGYRWRVAFLAGAAIGQVSEFSLIILALAVRAGQVEKGILSLVGMTAVVTMAVSAYMIMHAEKLYAWMKRWIPIREPESGRVKESENIKAEVVLFGHNRTGSVLRPALEKLGLPLLVVDFDPQRVEQLKREGVETIYGDAADYDLYDEIGLDKAKLVVSTVSDMNDNLQLLEYLREKEKGERTVVVTAADDWEARKLYAAGAEYVLIPHAVGGEYLAHIFNHHGLDRKYVRDCGQRHQKRLM